MIELHHLSKTFRPGWFGARDTRPAVDDLTLSVPKGGIFGLLGHNGAGKSTTLGMLLGQVFPDAGTVTIGGHDAQRQRAKALARVGAIFETPAFYDYLTGRRNLRILCDYTAPPRKGRLDEVIELVNLGDAIDAQVSTYSHGMRQRLALAQALLPDPELLILDEPSDGLDPEGIRDMRALMRRLSREMGLTLLFSSHLLAEVEALCDRVAVMRKGRLVFEGEWRGATPDRLFSLQTDRQAEAVELLRQAGLAGAEHPGQKYELAEGADTAAANRLLHERGFAVHAISPTTLTLEEFYLSLGETSMPTPTD